MKIPEIPQRPLPILPSGPIDDPTWNLLGQLETHREAIWACIASRANNLWLQTAGHPFRAAIPGLNHPSQEDAALAVFETVLRSAGPVAVPGRAPMQGFGLKDARPLFAYQGEDRYLTLEMRWSDAIFGGAIGVLQRSAGDPDAAQGLIRLFKENENVLSRFLASPLPLSGLDLGTLYRRSPTEFASALERQMSAFLVSRLGWRAVDEGGLSELERALADALHGFLGNQNERIVSLHERGLRSTEMAVYCSAWQQPRDDLAGFMVVPVLMVTVKEPSSNELRPFLGAFDDRLGVKSVRRALEHVCARLERHGFSEAKAELHRYETLRTKVLGNPEYSMRRETRIFPEQDGHEWRIYLRWGDPLDTLTNQPVFQEWAGNNMAARELCGLIMMANGIEELERVVLTNPQPLTAEELVAWGKTFELENLAPISAGRKLLRELKVLLDQCQVPSPEREEPGPPWIPAG